MDSWVKIEERSFFPFDMFMGHRVRNLGSTNSAIIYIKVFLKAGFFRCRSFYKKKYLAVDIA